jgi:hypothetical protein
LVSEESDSASEEIEELLTQNHTQLDLDTRYLPLMRTCLHRLVSRGNVHLTTQLIELGASVNLPDARDCTPLHEAAVAGYVTLCALLLDSGADIDWAKSNGSTALHRAINNHHFRTAKLLVQRGADVNITTSGVASTPMKLLIRNMPSVAKVVLDMQFQPVRKVCVSSVVLLL